MMYESLFEELETILTCPVDARRQENLEDFFMRGPGRSSVDWAWGHDRRSVAHLFVHALSPDSPLWNEAYLTKLSPLLPEFLVAGINQDSAAGDALMAKAYRIKANHPLITLSLTKIANQAGLDCESPDELILNHTKRQILISLFASSTASLSASAKRLLQFCQTITQLQKEADSCLFYKAAFSSRDRPDMPDPSDTTATPT